MTYCAKANNISYSVCIPPLRFTSDMRQSIIEEELLLTGKTLPSFSICGQLINNQRFTVNIETSIKQIFDKNLKFHPVTGKPGHGVHWTMLVKERSSQFFMTPRVVFC